MFAAQISQQVSQPASQPAIQPAKKWELLIQFRAMLSGLAGHRRIKMPLCKFPIVLECVGVAPAGLPFAAWLLRFHFIFSVATI